MKKLTLLLLAAQLVMTSSLHAVTYPFSENEPVYQKDGTVMKVGTRLYLFHSGTGDVKNTIHVNDILAVYRENPPNLSPETGETGKVKVLSCSGRYYYEAEVIEGTVQPGNLAKKGTVACFVIKTLN